MKKRLGPPNLQNISLSPNYRYSDWKGAKQNNSIDWNLATDIFWDRISSRFLKPIELISHSSIVGEFCGFLIIAIDCLIIETLNQFYTGKDETPQRKSEKAFWDFFKQSKHFSSQFDEQKAAIFYQHFRCGILHQAQTKKSSIVRIKQAHMIEPSNPNKIDDGLIVDREKFHNGLVDEIDDYINKLKSGKPEHIQIRENFIRKMDHICMR